MSRVLAILFVALSLTFLGCSTPAYTTVLSVQQLIVPETTKLALASPSPSAVVEEEVSTQETPTVSTVTTTEEKEPSSTVSLLADHMVSYDLKQETAEKYATFIVNAVEKAGEVNGKLIDPFTVLAIIQVETGRTFKFSDSPNSHGAIGLMQILQRNVKCNSNNSCTNSVWEGYSVKDLYDPEKNITLGVAYLKYLMDRFGYDLGITAYNQGEGNVSRKTYNQKYYNLVQKAYKEMKKDS